jgi:hypothetical protein
VQDDAVARDAPQTEELYWQKLRQMTGEQRLRRAFELCRLAWRLAEANVRNDNPGMPDAEVKARVRARLP